MTDSDPPYALLEAKLGYAFIDVARLESALTHKSYVNENPSWGRPDNERLEFLGDAVLDLVVGHLLMDADPVCTEGELSKTRATFVSEAGLCEVAVELGLGEWLFLGRGEEASGGRRRPSVLANACEAVAAAVYLDGGLPAAFELGRRLFGGRIGAGLQAGAGDFKTRLQERVARERQTLRYQIMAERGPDHAKIFEVAVLVGEVEVARAEGRTKKEAEQRAAKTAFERPSVG